MKKIVALVLALTLTFAMTACGGSSAQETTPAETTAAAVTLPGSALEILETVWNGFGEEEKFPIIGGSMAAPVDGAPGSFDLADENISFNLLIPAEQLANVTEAASMIHMMNANTFTGAAYKLADGVAAADFAAAMQSAVQGNMWMCGFPEELVITSFGDAYVAVAFGVADVMTPYKAHLAEAYPDAVTLISEPIA